MSTSRLDDLPPELFHQLFGYFVAHEILHSFTHLTSYIDSILVSYADYRVNFKAISKSHFDLVCQQINPDQVITLTLSNDEDTPGLIDEFLSRFQIHQFTRLQALKMIEIGADFWEAIITQMVTLKHLQSFQYYPSNRDNAWICNLSADQVTELDKSLSNTYTPILPQLFELRLIHSDYLHSIQLPYLRRLTLERGSVEIIERIASAAPQLQSLDTVLSHQSLSTKLIPPMPRLRGLILRVQGKNANEESTIDVLMFLGSNVPMDVWEQMLSNLPRLRHLTLFSSCHKDVIDGHRWESSVKNLLTFTFKFSIYEEIESEQLKSFRTSFWLDQKKWFVAYMNGRFFSLSTSKSISLEKPSSHVSSEYTTLPDTIISNQEIREFTLSKRSFDSNSRYSYVETLILRNPPPLLTITKVIDLSQVRTLKLFRLRKNFPIKVLLSKMPDLSQLSINCNLEQFHKQVRYQVFHKIRTLSVNEFDILMDVNVNDIENLSTIFPHLEHLHVHSPCTIGEISDFLHAFKYLCKASFSHTKLYSFGDREEYRVNIQSRLDQMRHKEGLNFTYRFDSSWVYCWIGPRSDHRS